MMKGKIPVLFFALLMIFSAHRSFAQRGKSEIAVGYGYYSIYSYVQGAPYSASSGVSNITYRYYINKNVTMGMGIGYENISTWGSFLSFVPEMTFCYLDTRNDMIRVRLYGALAYGVSVFDDLNPQAGRADRSGLKPSGFQATPLGMRIGRQVAGFIEVGVGYKGTVHGGLEVRFPRILRQHRMPE
jgi:hypothetical protein